MDASEKLVEQLIKGDPLLIRLDAINLEKKGQPLGAEVARDASAASVTICCGERCSLLARSRPATAVINSQLCCACVVVLLWRLCSQTRIGAKKSIETSPTPRVSRPLHLPADVLPGQLQVTEKGEDRDDDDSGRLSG
ncbi:hypothetical protein [Pseudomonas sp. A34-9]|uniref:hypothetical protein n=1 Tax=Pseudomonas sp. A34-9 TaxID=3034675 RepID=UPI00240D4F0F|nr:hypothetical protein [Pseudomonas sp. A34-9]